jgi:hypothetical protein
MSALGRERTFVLQIKRDIVQTIQRHDDRDPYALIGQIGPRPNIDEYYSSGSIGFRKRDNYLLALLRPKQGSLFDGGVPDVNGCSNRRSTRSRHAQHLDQSAQVEPAQGLGAILCVEG